MNEERPHKTWSGTSERASELLIWIEEHLEALDRIGRDLDDHLLWNPAKEPDWANHEEATTWFKWRTIHFQFKDREH